MKSEKDCVSLSAHVLMPPSILSFRENLLRSHRFVKFAFMQIPLWHDCTDMPESIMFYHSFFDVFSHALEVTLKTVKIKWFILSVHCKNNKWIWSIFKMWKKKMTPEGIEPPTLRSGVSRATYCAKESFTLYEVSTITFITFINHLIM